MLNILTVNGLLYYLWSGTYSDNDMSISNVFSEQNFIQILTRTLIDIQVKDVGRN